MKLIVSRFTTLLLVTLLSTASNAVSQEKQAMNKSGAKTDGFVVEAESATSMSAEFATSDAAPKHLVLPSAGWLAYDVEVATAGRYRVQVHAQTEKDATFWVEDYVGNKDGRTYNVTGSIALTAKDGLAGFSIEGTPLNAGKHKMKFHFSDGSIKFDKVEFTLMREHQGSPKSMTQKMDGEKWELVWSDEFDKETIDDSVWTYDIGNWGWGNNELQYYTEKDTDNARIEDGNLIIEARKNDDGRKWTSARLTTRGKISFLYGKIEMRAKVPREKGCWAAGWTLGDEYVDEMSWPYCGEIDILESVGFETNNETGDGIAHATCHTPAYYFKINNQISAQKNVAKMADEFHTYSIEWTPTEVRAYVDGEKYYVYDKNANEKEWPFDKPQNIIMNLAMGGGWGGAKGMDETVTSQKYVIDYVRVYEKR